MPNLGIVRPPAAGRFWYFLFAGVRLRAAAVTTFFHVIVTAGFAQPVLSPAEAGKCLAAALGRL